MTAHPPRGGSRGPGAHGDTRCEASHQALPNQFYCAYNQVPLITYDQAKNQRNIEERGLSFDQVADFEFESALVQVDARFDYSETRYLALGFLHGRLHVLWFAETSDGIRVISFRKANSREVSRHAKVQTPD